MVSQQKNQQNTVRPGVKVVYSKVMSPKHWVKYGSGQPVKVCLDGCTDVSDCIEVVKQKLSLPDRLDELHLLIMDGIKGAAQKPGQPLAELLRRFPLAGKTDDDAIMVRTIRRGHVHDRRHAVEPLDLGRYIRAFINSGPCQSSWKEIQAINEYTVGLILESLFFATPVALYSATGLLILFQVSFYVLLCRNESLLERHFTNSAQHMADGHYWTLLSSSLAHGDINHLLCNVAGCAAMGPVIENYLGLGGTLMFWCLASIASSIVSWHFHGHPSIGSSGAVFAMHGYLLRQDADQMDWIYLCVDYFFHVKATTDVHVDHHAHAGGLAFGYFYGGFAKIPARRTIR
jgi:membrane associated rhomboid family serine protease